uniref:Gelsolin-like domain-containing protein n=1 Tax=Ditylenchus dipsaci TaxID=166011 RepID=A0A915DNG0_9BILA
MAIQLAGSFPTSKPPPTNILHLEGLDLRHTDENLFTEELLFYQLHGEQLTRLSTLEELDDQSCYVLEWNYRVEREGVRKLNGRRISSNHETGRQRQVFFYWLGSRSSIKDQSKCALSLRDHDKARQEHIRVEQGLEPAIFLSLLEGKMVVKGADTGWFLVIGGQDLLTYSAEELYMPVEFRTQSAYIQVLKDQQQIVMWKGEDCPERVLEASKRFAIKMAGLSNFPLLKPREWSMYPRFIRIYGNEGHELSSARCCEAINFCFRQSDLRDCMLVDQGNHLWIWAESTSGPVTTFALRVAHYYWKKKTSKKTQLLSLARELSRMTLRRCSLHGKSPLCRWDVMTQVFRGH